MTASQQQVSVEEVARTLKGFEQIEVINGSTYRDCSTILVVPTRGSPHGGSLSPLFVSALNALLAPMNQKRVLMFSCGHEVGAAYNAFIEQILAVPGLGAYKYLLTIEDDNIPPRDAHIRLIESIEQGPYDAVSGLYFTKGEINEPMAFGDPKLYDKMGTLDFKPINVRDAYARGEKVIEVNGIAMGCTLWRLDLFKAIPGPWFVTGEEKGTGFVSTQDLHFCRKARRCAKRFAVDLRVKVGHFDRDTGEVF